MFLTRLKSCLTDDDSFILTDKFFSQNALFLFKNLLKGFSGAFHFDTSNELIQVLVCQTKWSSRSSFE